jgi:hypothetical protein
MCLIMFLILVVDFKSVCVKCFIIICILLILKYASDELVNLMYRTIMYYNNTFECVFHCRFCLRGHKRRTFEQTGSSNAFHERFVTVCMVYMYRR